MIEIRRASERGHGQTHWLESRHSFSFADYHDPDWMGYRALRVINEDWIAPRSGFPNHPHANMEILTYVLDGVIEHRDSEGSASRLHPGDVQVMSAGRGIVHSEANPSSQEALHLYQIWIEPDRRGTAPGYRERHFELPRNALRPIASPDGRAGSLEIKQDAVVSVLRLDEGTDFELPTDPERHVWMQVARGEAAIEGSGIEAGDGVALHGQGATSVHAQGDFEALVFDLA